MLERGDSIVGRLAAADREHQKERGGAYALRSVKYLCAWLLGMGMADLILHLSAVWRLRLLLGTVGAGLLVAVLAWYIAFVRRNRLEHTARLLEDRDPALGSRLINLLQLREQAQDNSLPPMTRELSQLAVEEYAAELSRVPLDRLAWGGELRRQFWRATWVLAAFLVLCGACFRISVIELARFADPYGDHPPYSFTRLEIVEPGLAGTNVLYGKGVVVKSKASGHQPREVFLTAFEPGHPDRGVTVPMFDKGKAGYHQLVDNVLTELLVFAHTKDGSSRSKQARIGVILTPQLERAFIQITPPAYTGLKPEESPYAMKGVQALAGSELRFRLQSNRPLREGLVEINSGTPAPERVPLKRTAENEVAGTFAAKDSGRLRFSLVDVAGLPSQEDWQGALTVTHDLPPEIRLTEPERDSLVAADFKLQARVEASDDYGLKVIRIHCGLNGVYKPPKVISYNTIVRNSHEVADIDFAKLGVQPGDTIALFAEAIDTAPEEHLARSQTVQLKVISVEEYNDLLRQQTDIAETAAKYAALLEDMQELIENQEKLGAAAQQVLEQLARTNSLDQESLARKLDDLLAKQNELNQQLRKHAERMDQFVRQNPLYDVEQELQALLQEEAEQIRQSTRTNDAAGGDIVRRSSPAGGARQVSPGMLSEFKKASDDQLARLGAVRKETQNEVADTLQDMSLMQELLKDFNQFEALYQAQQELATHAQAYDRPGQLEREDQLALKDLAGGEKQVGDLLEQLEQKLRDDAKAAEKLFPKASQSGTKLAEAINELRLQPLARQATSQMLAANGERSFRLADRLRSEMAKLYSECQGGNCPSAGELDTYLQLQRQMNPGKNFAQMSRSRKFGTASSRGMGVGSGDGMMGSSGYAVMSEVNMDLLGNESASSRSAAARASDRLGKGNGGRAGPSERAAAEKADVLKGLNPVNRQSGAVSSEAVIEEYSDLVESYFKAITTKKGP